MREFDQTPPRPARHFRTFAFERRCRTGCKRALVTGSRRALRIDSFVRAVLLRAVVALAFAEAAGCSITGHWERIETDPPGVPFPVEEVTFSDSNEYAARWQQYGRTQFSVGTYKLLGTRLDVQQYGSKPLRYDARVRRDGLLELVYSHEGQKVKALLQRKDEAQAELDAPIDESNAPEITEVPKPSPQ